MRARRSTTKHTLNKGDLLDQKWLTYFLAIVLILLVLVFVVLLSPTYKRYVVDTVKSVFYGKEQKAPRPKASPVKFQQPVLPDGLIF
ncbi:hypothetical protein F4009_16490 [Candidatus Poribacteria bacterium]|nr:hypothetical protein [Candidatus Poribacteria bacterium]MYH82843.1 hypothetical protein [Candidatus Poribacteria bacterium]MYK95569.1 hypothetical protein [Candidatus Poribacteria bacterium]